MSETCLQCGKSFQRIGTHWTKSSSCSHPEPSDKILDILTGLMMSDGTLHTKPTEKRNAKICVGMVNKKYLDWLKSVLGDYAKEVHLHRSAEEAAEHLRNGNIWHRESKSENCQDFYMLRTTSNPHFNTFGDWYSSGKKVWPKDISLTPTVLKHLYVGDGTKHKGEYMNIALRNEIDNKEKVENYFSQRGLPAPSRWNKSNMCWDTKSSQILWEYMGSPPPGFEYKWP